MDMRSWPDSKPANAKVSKEIPFLSVAQITGFMNFFKAENIYIKTCDTSSNHPTQPLLVWFFPPPNCAQCLWPRPFFTAGSGAKVAALRTRSRSLPMNNRRLNFYPVKMFRCSRFVGRFFFFRWFPMQNEYPKTWGSHWRQAGHDLRYSRLVMITNIISPVCIGVHWLLLREIYWHTQLWFQGTASHTSVNLVSSGTSQLESSQISRKHFCVHWWQNPSQKTQIWIKHTIDLICCKKYSLSSIQNRKKK